MGFDLGQGANRSQHGNRDQLPHAVVQTACIADISKNVTLQNLHKFAVRSFISGGMTVKQLLHFLFCSFFSIHE